VAVECVFTWYWLADLCAHEGIPFVLGHALYMNAIHGGKATHDTLDAHQSAALLRGGMRPQADVYPAQMRATRDLLRRRTYLMRTRAELLAHVQHPNSPYHLPEIGKNIAYTANRTGIAERFPEPAMQKSIAVDLGLIDDYDRLLTELELDLVQTAKAHEAQTFSRRRPMPGIEKILALVWLYEIHDIHTRPMWRRDMVKSPPACLGTKIPGGRPRVWLAVYGSCLPSFGGPRTGIVRRGCSSVHEWQIPWLFTLVPQSRAKGISWV
jgi:hypothetical protein